MNNKTKRIIWIILGILPSLLLAMSAIMKFMRGEEVVKGFTAMGMAQYLPVFATIEVICLITFWYPKTHKLGLLLVTAYLGGAMATELAHGKAPFMPALMIALFWISAFIKDSKTFLHVQEA